MSSALSNIVSARTQNEQLQAQANQAYYSAEASRKQGMAAEQNILAQTKAAAGAAETSAAGSGVVFNEGSALDNIKRTVYQGTKDAMQARSNAYMTAANQQATGESYEAAKQSTTEILLSGLSGAGQDYLTYSKLFA